MDNVPQANLLIGRRVRAKALQLRRAVSRKARLNGLDLDTSKTPNVPFLEEACDSVFILSRHVGGAPAVQYESVALDGVLRTSRTLGTSVDRHLEPGFVAHVTGGSNPRPTGTTNRSCRSRSLGTLASSRRNSMRCSRCIGARSDSAGGKSQWIGHRL
jgi:hypothetical protein